MVRITFALLFAVSVAAVADDKPYTPPVIDVKLDKDDKFEVTFGKWMAPTKVTSEDELKKLVPDEKTRARIARRVDLKTHDLLVFAWKGSGRDTLSYNIAESKPEQVGFTLKHGETDDLREHLKLYGVRKNVRWSAE